MTPAIEASRMAGVNYQIHEYSHDPSNASYGAEAAEKLGVTPERVFKTLVVNLEGAGLAVAVVPVPQSLNLKLAAKAAGVKKARMADKAEVERVTGYVLGGVSPLGQKKRLPTFIDQSAQDFDAIYVSAGRRGLEIELSAADLQDLTQATCVGLCG